MTDIAVLIPTFRRPALLAQALEGCLAQTRRGFSVVVVDNDPDASAAAVLAAAGPRFQAAGIPLHAVHETAPGISHARNRALAETTARIVVFLDDDQAPAPGWLSALTATLDSTGAAAAFGPVTAVLDCAADWPLRAFAARYFGRAIDRPDGADITDLRARMGTQNSAFDRAHPATGTLWRAAQPFDADLGAVGGEDSVLLRRLVGAGGRLAWAAAAAVEETVPASRCTLRYLRRRRFRDGQIRVLSALRTHPPKVASAAAWTLIGAAQVAVHGSRALALRALGRPAEVSLIGVSNGLGKLAWGRRFRFPLYGATAEP